MRPLQARTSLKSPGRTALSLLYVAIGLLFSGVAFGQGSVVSGHPVVTNGVGQPVPGATVAVCSSNPGTAPTTPCTNLATTFTDITDSIACVGSQKPLNNQSHPATGAGCSNPGFTDGRGNVVVFAAASTYWCEYYGRGIIGIYVVPCIFPGVGGGVGGSNISVNGNGQASANFNSTNPLADAGFTPVKFKTDGNNVIGELPSLNPLEFCLLGSGLGSQLNIGFQGTTDPCTTPWAEILQQSHGGAGFFGPTTFFDGISSETSLDLTQGTLYVDKTNCSPNPALTNHLAKFDGACVTLATIFDTTNVIGVSGVSGGAGLGTTIAVQGQIPLVMDGPTTAGDSVINSLIIPGAGHDTGSVLPQPGMVGYIQSTNSGAGLYVLFVCNCGGGGGSSTVTNAAQYSLPFYSAPGTTNTISGAAPPSVNGQYYAMYNVTGGTPVAPGPVLVGLSSRSVLGTTSTDAILYSDNASHVDYQGSVSVATSLNTATSFGNSQFITVLNNNTTGTNTTVTVTAATWLINGASTLVIAQGQSCKIKVDAAGGAWDAECAEGQIAAGTNITITRSPTGFSIAAAGGGGGSSVWSALTAPVAGLTINHSIYSTEFDWTLPNNAAGAFLLKGNDSTGVDTSPILAADTVSGSHQNPLSIGITGVKQLQVCWQAGPQGQTVIGSVVACSGINNTIFSKFHIQSTVATHTLVNEWQANSGYTATMNTWSTATVAGTGFYFFKCYTGVTSTDTSFGGGTNSCGLRGDGTFFGLANLTALTLPSSGSIECLHKSALGVVTGTGSDCGAGSNTINNAAQYAFPYYSAAGSANTISGLAAPTGPNGVPQVPASIPAAGAATAPVLLLPGLGGRAITGTTSTDTIVSTDCNPKRVEYVGSVAVAITLPTATTLAVGNCTFRIANNTTGSTTALTITPTTWTINGSATLTVSQGQIALITPDPNSATNWVADVTEQKIIAGSNITLTRSALGVTVTGLAGTVTSITTNSPITGGAITTFGNVGCTTCVVASSPGVGIAHFGGSTQTVTSSAVDLSGADATGTMAAARMPALTGDVTTSAGAVATTIGAAKVAPSMMKASTFDTQTDAATVTWAIGSVLNANAVLTFTVHSGSRALNITGPVIGGNYVLKLIQDGTGGEGLTLGTGCTWKVIGGGAGAITLTASANAIDILAFTYDGTNCLANIGKNYN